MHWRFIHLNQAFRSVIGSPMRTLHVYSDIGGSSIVGGQVTDLLREVHGSGFSHPLDGQQSGYYTALTRTKKTAVLLSKQEQAPYQGGAVRTLVFKPHSELFHLNKPLVPGVEIKLRFTFKSPDFFLNGVALHGRLTPRIWR